MSNLKHTNSKLSTKSTKTAPKEEIKQKKILALPLGDYEDPIVCSSFTLHDEYKRRVEPCGEAFELYLFKKLNPDHHELLDDVIDDEEVLEEDVEEYEWEVEFRKSKKFSSGFSAEKDNYYTLLGLEEKFINSDADDIRRAYKKLALIHHPDKKECANEEEKQEANKLWIKLKDGYETLTDPDKKLKYDSTFKFDDSIPSEEDCLKKIKSEKHFYRLFGPTFLKNSIWSNRKPVPKIGDEKTDIKKVKRFYNFWFSFSSWRDFETEGEHDLNDAENRWEKRQMLKENKKLKASKIKEEKERIKKLTEIAYANDPRIIAEEKRLEEEKERIKKERHELALKMKIQKEEEEKRLKAELEAKKKREAEELVILKKTLYEELMKLIKEDLEITLTNDDIFSIKINISVDYMKTIISECEACKNKEDKLNKFKDLSSKMLGLKFVDERKESTIWSREEISNLQKAVKKYPAGTGNRWDKILEIVKTKSTNQIIKMTHYLAMNPGMKMIGDTVDLKVLLGIKKEKKEEKKEEEKKEEVEKKDENDWSDNQQKALEAALKKYPASLPANERWTSIASEVEGKNKKQCVERFKHLAQLLKKK